MPSACSATKDWIVSGSWAAPVDERLVARCRLRLTPLGDQPAQRGPERVQLGADREPPRPPGRHQRLGERPERRRDAPGHRPPGQDREPVGAGRARDLPDQPRLPDPGFPGQQNRAAVPRLRRRQGSLQMAGLLIPPHQHRAQHLPHMTSIGSHG